MYISSDRRIRKSKSCSMLPRMPLGALLNCPVIKNAICLKAHLTPSQIPSLYPYIGRSEALLRIQSRSCPDLPRPLLSPSQSSFIRWAIEFPQPGSSFFLESEKEEMWRICGWSEKAMEFIWKPVFKGGYITTCQQFDMRDSVPACPELAGGGRSQLVGYFSVRQATQTWEIRSCSHHAPLLNTGLWWAALAHCLYYPGQGKLAVFDSVLRGQGQGLQNADELGTSVIVPFVSLHYDPPEVLRK
jgi:hypothetical protein